MIVRRERRLRGAASIIASLAVLVGVVIVDTELRAADAPPAAASVPSAGLLKPARPYWIELTGEQRRALAPLAEDWERLDVQTKKKWIEIGNRYPKMNPDEQSRTQQRLREWALLTPDQRRVARDSFARVRAMNPEQRADMLRKYHALPPEKRQALTKEGRANKVIVVPKPSTVPVPRRVQIREGAKVRNPALAAQKSTNPSAATPKAEPRAAAATPASAVDPIPAAPSQVVPAAAVPTKPVAP
ncbi:MAG: DUF3106 domain-containing protein [Burkholderiaceae bacterium]